MAYGADADADARVAHRRARGRELERRAARIVSADTPAKAATRSGVKAASRSLDLRPPAGRAFEPDAIDRAHASTSTCAMASSNAASPPGSDRDVLVGLLRGLGAARIDDDHLAAARAHGAEPARACRAPS